MTVFTICSAAGVDARTQGSENSGAPVARSAGLDAFFGALGVFYGTGTISGTTQVQTGMATFSPIPNCKVMLFHLSTGLHLIDTVSDSSGHYTFENLNPDKSYLAVAIDTTGTYDATATQNLQVVS